MVGIFVVNKIYWCNCVCFALARGNKGDKWWDDGVIDGAALHAWLWFWCCFVPSFHALILCRMREKWWWWFEALLVLEAHFRTKLVSHIIKCHFVCITVVTICYCVRKTQCIILLTHVLFYYYETDRNERMLAKKTCLRYIKYSKLFHILLNNFGLLLALQWANM